MAQLIVSPTQLLVLSILVSATWLLVVKIKPSGALNHELKSRFSLRTLLIATTLVAVVLGLGVWLSS